MKIVICGLSITSSWGNGHATTYRALVQGLCRRGHEVLFLERDKPWYASHRDLTELPMGAVALYNGLSELDRRFRADVVEADFVMIGSFVPEGAAVAEWALHHARGVVGFYDIDTPVTLGKLRSGDEEFLNRAMIPRFEIYLSFTGGRTLKLLEEEYGARWAVPLYCSVDPEVYYPEKRPRVWDLGYLGTYSEDRQPALERFLLEPDRKLPDRHFALAGSMYPPHLSFPPNVERMEHLAPSHHRKFYNAQKFTLNITRRQMIEAGYSPSIRLFEAGACEV